MPHAELDVPEPAPGGDSPAAAAPSPRKRPKPGERRVQILQALATMLEQPGTERITTAALAARLEVSEAALYRHFASKAQMFEGLIEFIEQSVFTLINQITERDPAGAAQAGRIVAMLIQFAEKNPGMARVMVGDALVYENERLQQRMNQFVERLELALKQALRLAVSQGQMREDEVALRANLICSYVLGRWQRFVKSGFKQDPAAEAGAQILLLLT